MNDIITVKTEIDVQQLYFLDVEKAFDKVWPKGLIVKLTNLGLSNTYVSWIDNFLSWTKNLCKSWKPLQHTIHTGLWSSTRKSYQPPFIILYVSDIPTSLDCQQSQFADDIAIWATEYIKRKKNALKNGLQTKMQNQLDRLYLWCDKWRIGLNASKTIQVNFRRKNQKGKRSRSPTQQRSNSKQSRSKILGVTLDDTLTLNSHLSNVKEKCQNRLVRIYTLPRKFDPQILLTVYKSFVRSVMDYCPVTSLCLKDHQIKTLEVLQTKFIRFAYHLPRTH